MLEVALRGLQEGKQTRTETRDEETTVETKKQTGMISPMFSQPGRFSGQSEYSHLGRQWSTATPVTRIGRTMCSPSLTRPVPVPGRLLLPSARQETARKSGEPRKSRHSRHVRVTIRVQPEISPLPT